MELWAKVFGTPGFFFEKFTGRPFMLKLNSKEGGQSIPYSNFNIALGSNGPLGHGFWPPKVSSNKA